ncbi:MAG: SpoIIE family protein phosphatase [Rhodospirillaceae bacterium]|jgi:phosphoserine phosphatase RsbU/P|nr:SpoIIE family protein phosphatase [Rhodospirillaceae bacterium]
MPSMSIRWKLLLLLLALSLVPIIGLGLFDHLVTRDQGNVLSTHTNEQASSRAIQRLLQMTEDQVLILRRSRGLMELAVEVQAVEVEKALAGKGPAADKGEGAKTYNHHDFDDPDRAPSDLAYSEKHGPQKVSYGYQSYYLPTGGDEKAAEKEKRLLNGMVKAYARLQSTHPDLIFHQYTALKSGLLATYPGHGGFPAGFDPRQRPWYQRTASGEQRKPGEKFLWSLPYVDATSGQIAFTISMPIFGPDGEFAGITAIDVLMKDVFHFAGVPAEWELSLEAMIVFVDERPTFGDGQLAIFARRGDGEGMTWQRPRVNVEYFTPIEDAGYESLLRAIAKGNYGIRLMPYEGQISFWAYGPADDIGSALLLILPLDVVLEEARQGEQFIENLTLKNLRSTGLATLIVGAIVLLVAFYGARSVTNPIRALTDMARRISTGDFGARAKIGGKDELGELACRFNEMMPMLEDRLRMIKGLNLAKEVQENLIPKKSPDIPGFDIAGTSISCDEIGGDYLDFLDLSNVCANEELSGCHAIAVGDVSGHGAASALLMATARALLHGLAGSTQSLSGLIGEVNRRLTLDIQGGRFMTLFCAIIHAPQRRLSWVSAGHDPALVYNPETDAFSELAGGDIPLGIDPDWSYSETETADFPIGHIVTVATDGVWETRNSSGDMFGKDRFRDVIRTNKGKKAAEICRKITESLAEFRGDAIVRDDVTMVVLKLI